MTTTPFEPIDPELLEQVSSKAAVQPLMVYLYNTDRASSQLRASTLLSALSAKHFRTMVADATMIAVTQEIDKITKAAVTPEQKREVLPQLLRLEVLLNADRWHEIWEGENA